MRSEKSIEQHYFLYFAWIVAVIATLGSLYFSEVREYIPCELCWYQRILMYPLSVILGIAAYNNDASIKKYVLPLSIVGGSIYVYHYMLQKVPGFEGIKPCTNGVPCNVDYINWLGFITIPFLALIAFILITISLLFLKQTSDKIDRCGVKGERH
jgi:disulfide bond formation protein DsbB